MIAEMQSARYRSKPEFYAHRTALAHARVDGLAYTDEGLLRMDHLARAGAAQTLWS